MVKDSGFTLIELMIVVAIIGILAAIAIPSYHEYVAKAQASEAVSLLGGKKIPMAEYYMDEGIWPASFATIVDEGTTGNHVATISVTDGGGASGPVEMTATFHATGVSAFLKGRHVLMTSTNGTSWTCSSNDLDSRFLPAACR